MAEALQHLADLSIEGDDLPLVPPSPRRANLPPPADDNVDDGQHDREEQRRQRRQRRDERQQEIEAEAEHRRQRRQRRHAREAVRDANRRIDEGGAGGARQGEPRALAENER